MSYDNVHSTDFERLKKKNIKNFTLGNEEHVISVKNSFLYTTII